MNLLVITAIQTCTC